MADAADGIVDAAPVASADRDPHAFCRERARRREAEPCRWRRPPPRCVLQCRDPRRATLRWPTMPIDSVDDVRAGLAAHDYLADEGLGDGRVPRAAPAPPAAARRRGRRRQDRGGERARGMDRRRARPAAVLRGHRRRAGRLRVGLRPPAAARAHARGDAPARARRRRGRAVLRAVPRAPAAAACHLRCRRRPVRRRSC